MPLGGVKSQTDSPKPWFPSVWVVHLWAYRNNRSHFLTTFMLGWHFRGWKYHDQYYIILAKNASHACDIRPTQMLTLVASPCSKVKTGMIRICLDVHFWFSRYRSYFLNSNQNKKSGSGNQQKQTYHSHRLRRAYCRYLKNRHVPTMFLRCKV